SRWSRRTGLSPRELSLLPRVAESRDDGMAWGRRGHSGWALASSRPPSHTLVGPGCHALGAVDGGHDLVGCRAPAEGQVAFVGARGVEVDRADAEDPVEHALVGVHVLDP